jgi:hypothetical protein
MPLKPATFNRCGRPFNALVWALGDFLRAQKPLLTVLWDLGSWLFLFLVGSGSTLYSSLFYRRFI